MKPIRFETRWRSADDSFTTAINKLAELLEDCEGSASTRQRRRKEQDREKFRLSLECIAVNLFAVEKAEPGASLAIPLANSASRLSPIYGAHFRTIIDLMASLRLLTRTTGHRYSRIARKASTVHATRRLYRYLPEATATNWDAIRLLADPSTKLIVLRPEKSDEGAVDDIVFRESQQTRKWESEVRFINERLTEAPITIAGHAAQAFFHLADGGSDILQTLITGHHRALRRVFNNGDTTGRAWQEGGRLAGGYWMTMEREKRFREIRIDGAPIVNVDFQQLFLRLAYAKAGQEMPSGLNEADPYLAGEGERDGWKRLTNALIFRKAPLKQWPGRDHRERDAMRGYFPLGTKPSAAVRAIKEKHAAIASCFERGLGFGFMRTESDILIAGVSSLLAQGITALPLHDAVLVAEGHAKQAQVTMEAEAQGQTGSHIPAKIETAADYGVYI